MFRSTADLLCLRKIFSLIYVKSRRGFAVMVEGERVDGSVNQGAKITSILYVIFTYGCTSLYCL